VVKGGKARAGAHLCMVSLASQQCSVLLTSVCSPNVFTKSS
jgi:hypothetical protein